MKGWQGFETKFKKCGYIDSKGTLKIPFKFVLARDFSEGLAAVKTKEDKRRTGYFYDADGKKRDVSALPLPPYENNEYWSFIDKLGNIVISTTYTTVSDFHCGRAQVKNEKKRNWISLTKRKLSDTLLKRFCK
ncbi:MAG: WG repeat-containing protein [Lewinellaceae bacterium]|nr:WG repeat-containing protein [Lewinellaceae bacterium]